LILVDHMIKNEISQGRIKITPFDESLINPSSLDVRLGNTFGEVKPTGVVINPTDPLSFLTENHVVGKGKTYKLKPGSMVLGVLQEDITLPSDISAKIMGKSSLGRLGLDNSSCAGWTDCGWAGRLVVELFNHTKYPILLTPGMKIGQIVFYKHCPAEHPYEAKGRYQGQAGLEGSKGV